MSTCRRIGIAVAPKIDQKPVRLTSHAIRSCKNRESRVLRRMGDFLEADPRQKGLEPWTPSNQPIDASGCPISSP